MRGGKHRVALTKGARFRSLVRVAQIARFPLVRLIYFILGLICLGFVFLSWLPGIPTADFVILALFFFARSSRRFEMWLRNHKVFGKMIRSYQGGLTVRAKTIALIGITISIGISAVLLTSNTTLRVILVAVAAFAWWYVLTRPTKALGAGT